MIRVLVYDGPQDWIMRTLRNGLIPANGTKRTPAEAWISSRVYSEDGPFEVNDVPRLHPTEVLEIDTNMQKVIDEIYSRMPSTGETPT